MGAFPDHILLRQHTDRLVQRVKSLSGGLKEERGREDLMHFLPVLVIYHANMHVRVHECISTCKCVKLARTHAHTKELLS